MYCSYIRIVSLLSVDSMDSAIRSRPTSRSLCYGTHIIYFRGSAWHTLLYHVVLILWTIMTACAWLPDILFYMQWVVNTQVASFVWAGIATEWIYNAFALWIFLKGFSYYINRVYSPTIFIVDPFSLMHFRWSSVSFSSRSMHNEVFTCHYWSLCITKLSFGK